MSKKIDYYQIKGDIFILKIFIFGIVGLLLSFFFINIAKADISESDLLYYYDFDSATSSETCYEYASSTKNLTLIGEATGTTTAEYIRSVSFLNAGNDTSGTNNDRCQGSGDYTTTWQLPTGNDFSFSFWFKKIADPAVEANIIYDDKGGSGNCIWYAVRELANQKIKFIFHASGGWAEWTSTSAVFTDTNWHFYTIIGQYTGMTTNFKVYQDGFNEIAGSWNNTTYANQSVITSSCGSTGHYLMLGSRNDSIYGVNGYLDDTAMFNKMLNLDERGDLLASSINEILNPTTSSFAGEGDVLFFFTNPYLCSNASTCILKYVYNQDYFYNHDYIDIYYRGSPTATTTTWVASSSVVDFNDILNRKENGLSFLTLTGTSTLSGLTYYDIIGHIYTTPGNVYSTSSTEIAYTLIVNWVEGFIAGDLGINNTSTDNNLFSVDTYHLACDDATWESTSSVPFLGINLDFTICKYKKWLLDVGIQPISWLLAKINNIKDELLDIFPFNIIETIKSDWASSTAPYISILRPKTALADGFSTSTGIYSGSMNMGINFLGEGTTTISFLSKASIVDLVGQNVFDAIYLILRIFIWLLFLDYCYYLAVNRMNEILGHE